jgi:signal transduction histidine kinase
MKEPSPAQGIAGRVAAFERFARLLAVLTASMGVAVLLGWSTGAVVLKSVHADLVAMNPTTAIGFVLAAVSLWLSVSETDSRSRNAIATTMAVSILAIAAFRLIGYLGPDVGIDRLLFRDRLDAEAIPNRMAPNTAAAFLLSGLALLGLRYRSRLTTGITQALSLLVFGIAIITLCGYVYQSAELVRVRLFIPMALHTAITFAFLSFGTLCARPRRGLFSELISDGTGSRMARGLLFAVFGIPLVLGWIRVRAESAGLFDPATGAALVAVAWTGILGATVWWQARALNRAEAARREDERRVATLNRELSTRTVDLEAANRELEAFSYSVSHDLRAPLRSITSFSQALLEDHAGALDPEGRDYLDRVVRAGRKMADLIEDIMILSRITRSEIVHTRVDMSGTAREIAEDLVEANSGRSVELVIEPDLAAEGDPKLLRIALANLLDNAWKFTGRVAHPRIEFGAMPSANGEHVFYVRDNGAGFDMRHTERLFGPFQRLHSDAEFPGTGVGLATVQRVVRRHGGRIWAESSVNQGAAFFFTLLRNGTHA